jgi:hypothetical protein
MSCDNCGDQAYTPAASIQLDIVQSICSSLEPGLRLEARIMEWVNE